MIKDLTKGNSFRQIILFTLPLLIGNLFQQFYNIADTIIVGRTVGMQALAAVGCTGCLMFLIIGYVFGFTTGMAIVISQRFGAGDMVGVRKSFAANLVLGFGMTIILTVALALLLRPLLQAMRTPPEIIDDAHRFISIIGYGVGTIVLFNLLSNCLRAVGNSRAPLVFLAIACLTNIGLVFAFICGFGMGVEGAALATVAAQLLSGLLCLPYILKKNSVFRLSRSDFSLTFSELYTHLRVGLPMGLQASIIAIGAIVLQFALNDLGVVSVAAFTAANRIDIIATMPLLSLAVAMATFTAQNYGAGKFVRIRSGVRQCIALSMAYSILVGATNVVFGRYFASFFIDSSEQALDLAHQFLVITGSCYCFLGLLLIFRYTLLGLGQSMLSTIGGTLELVMRVFAALILISHIGFLGVCVAGPLAWFGGTLPMVIAFVILMRKMIGKEKQQQDNIPAQHIPRPHESRILVAQPPEQTQSTPTRDISCPV